MRRAAPSLVLLCSAALAGAAEPGPRPFRLQRADEDWSHLRAAPAASDPWTRIKTLSPSDDSPVWLSIGGDARLRYEQFGNPQWGAAPEDDDGYWLQRYLLHADLRLSPNVRVFGQLQSSLESGRLGGPRPVDENTLDLHQAFVELSGDWGDWRVAARIGRQELSYGSSRLISIRESPNVRLAFDGAKLVARRGDWQFDAFWMRAVEDDRHEFDDQSRNSEQLWGVYATGLLSRAPNLRADLYYLGLRRDDTRFARGVADELRHSIGARLSGAQDGWDYNVEAVGQFGTFGSADIRAWTVASDTGFTWRSARWKPRLGLKANVTSGDDHLSDGELGTFNALYPRGAYFNELALVGPYNHTDLSPSVSFQPADGITITAQANFFWRTSDDDAVYNNSGAIARAPGDSDARYVGTVLQGQVDWQVNDFMAWSVVVARFFAGTFLEETGPAEDTDFIGTWVTLRF
jgi:hypothetical protein